MPRRLREDHPGAIHHVTSRGVARRTIFEATPDCRYFLSCLARQVRAGLLRVLAYSLLTTHFHLLVQSPRGELSRAMQRVLDAYSRHFNRTRHRDGPLFRGRFLSRLVEDEDYWVTVIRYIDSNPVDAGIVRHPADHPHGSARHYMGGTRPPWLHTGEIHRYLLAGNHGPDLRLGYVRAFPPFPPGDRRRWPVERSLAGAVRTGDRDEVLLAAAPEEVRERLRRRSLLADGTLPGLTVLHPEDAEVRVRGVLLAAGQSREDAEVRLCGALHLLSGLAGAEIGLRLGLSEATVRRRLASHRRVLREDPAWRRRLGEALCEGDSGERRTESYRFRVDRSVGTTSPGPGGAASLP